MTISAVTGRGQAVNSASHASLAMSPSSALTVGKEIFAACVTDNVDTTDGATSYHLVTDTHGHTWQKVFEETETDGAAADGCTVSLWMTKVTTQIEITENITNTYQGASNAAGIITCTECVVGAGMTLAWEPTAMARDSTDPSSVSLSGLTDREYLFFGLFGAEGNDNAKTPIANYTERFDARSGSSSTADVCIHVGTRILTGTGDTWESSAITVTNALQTLTAFYEVAESAPEPVRPKKMLIVPDVAQIAAVHASRI